MTRLQQKWMTDITLANMYNSEPAELFLQFKEKDEILVGRAAKAVLLAFAVHIELWMSSRPRLSWEGPAVVEDRDDRIG